MQSSARNNYLVTEVMTATPQRLQLMLIEAAIRFTELGRQHWQANENEKACQSLIRAQEIVGEILARMDYQQDDTGLTQRVASIYLFIFRCLMNANFLHDEKKLDDAIRILSIERDTWREVCQKLGDAKNSPTAVDDAATFSPAPAPHQSPFPAVEMDSPSTYSGGFSLDA
jgi:flagellar protein FliS